MADPVAPDVTREVRVFARSEDHYPLVNCEIEAFVGGESAGRTKDNNGQASFKITGPPGPVSIVVRYEGQELEPRQLAEGQDTVTIDFSDVFLGPQAVELAKARAKEKRAEARMAFFEKYFPALLGFVMLIIALTLAFTFKNSTPTQDVLLRITMSLAAGGIATIITGSLGLTLKLGPKLGVTAAGALGVFALTYLVHPDIIIHEDANVTAPAGNEAVPADNETGMIGNAT